MEIYSVNSEQFKKYGKVLDFLDTKALVEAMQDLPCPEDVVYEPSVDVLEKLEITKVLKDVVFGESEIQVGYCNGNNSYLNALEYHRSSEINIGATDAILLVGARQDVADDFTYDTKNVEAFLLPKGCAVELFATTLHYAPCNANGNKFRVCIVLPKGTNGPLEKEHKKAMYGSAEDDLLAANNKWLIGHKEGELPEGSFIGLIGENICVK